MTEGNQKNKESRMKILLLEMDKSEVSLQQFYEQLEKEFGTYCPFSKFKTLLESFYRNQPKSKLNLFLILLYS